MVLVLLSRLPDKCLELQLHKSVFVQMMWRMLAEQLDIIHSLRCLETLVLEITSRKKLLNGHGSFLPRSMHGYNKLLLIHS